MTTLRSGLRACSVKLLRREADLRFDERGIEAHAVRSRIDVGAGVLQHALASACMMSMPISFSTVSAA